MVTGGRARWGQRLLFVALLFGIATMHTVGHPSPGHGSGHVSGGQASAATDGHATAVIHAEGITRGEEHAAHTAPDTAAVAAVGSRVPEHGSRPASADAGDHAAVAGGGSRAPGDEGMDPASVCLAVLGAWGVVLLVVRLVARHPADHVLAAARARLLHTLRPNPPPPRTVLARLSVLRI
jgi:hypothetical protein